MEFYRAYVRFLNLAVRLFGELAILIGTVSLRMRLAGGVFSIAMGVAVFLAQPITVEQINLIKRMMGGTE